MSKVTNSTLGHALSSDMVGHDDGNLSVTFPLNRDVLNDYSVLVRDRDGYLGRERWVDHIIIARINCPALNKDWLVVYRMAVTSTGESKSRSYGAFNYAANLNEARTMQQDLIGYSQQTRDNMSQQPEQLKLTTFAAQCQQLAAE